MIDVAQRAGLSLDEIRELLQHLHPISKHLRALAERRLPEIDALIERAQRVRAWLQMPRAATARASTTARSSTIPAIRGQPGTRPGADSDRASP